MNTNKNNKELKNPKRRINRSEIIFIVFIVVVVVLIIASFKFNPPEPSGWFGLIFAILFIVGAILVTLLGLYDKRSRIMRVQSKLPVQHIGSLSPGLVKVQGKAKSITPVESPIESKTCVGYRYHIRKVEENDGTYYTDIEDRIECPRFIFADETGSIEVDTDSGRLEFIGMPVDKAHRREEDKLYEQYLLKEGQQMMLIGNISLEGSRYVMRRDQEHDVFAIAPLTDVSQWFKRRPFVRKLTHVTCLFTLLFVFVFFYLSFNVQLGVATIGLGEVLSGLLSNWLPDGASFSFRCGSWIESVISDTAYVIVFCVFGPLVAIPLLLLLGRVTEEIGLGFIAKWDVWYRLGVSLFASLVLNMIILLPLVAVFPGFSPENGLRMLLGALVIFIAVFVSIVVDEEWSWGKRKSLKNKNSKTK